VRAVRAGFPKDRTPFLVGHSVVCLQDRVVICGGGGVCFSMGSCTNDGIWTLSGNEKYDLWRFIEEGQRLEVILQDMNTPMSDTPIPETLAEAQLDGYGSVPNILDVKKVSISSPEEFGKIVEAGEPVVLQGLSIGSCIDSWTPEYLKSTVGNNRLVVVHMTRSSVMSFQQKNFKYQTMLFGEFLDAAFSLSLSSSPPHQRMYFRSLSVTKPNAAPANLHNDFPEIAQDFILPPPLSIATENLHSSPLRISSADVGMWLHYDGMANVLCHISGTKLFRLYPPTDVTKLSFPPGATTSTIPDIFSQTVSETTPYDVELNPGDIVYIPPLWLHAAKPLTPCIAVNVFFRNLSDKAYPHGKDVYASRDLAAYEKGRKKVEGIIKDFRELPKDMKIFYLLRLAEELKDGASRE
jgi:tRNA wybutosine-synthesizing protein 4